MQFLLWLKMFPDVMKRLFSGAGQMIIGVIRYWYFTMTIPAVLAVYYLLKALQDSGIMDRFSDIVDNTLESVHKITTECLPLILNIHEMYRCILSS